MNSYPKGYEGEQTFERELAAVINRHSQENASNTPDFILAQYMRGCLEVYNLAVQQRETWYGRDSRPTAAAPLTPKEPAKS